ncbi:hypothetical protein [Scytonema sp. PCC 10023]|uniref:hypothetical protein n=1 Tax=Scytonema sp. PCC 10023 TaxID=1680591 RepID=UPI0039C5B4A4
MEVTSANFAFSDWLSLDTGMRHGFRASSSKYRNRALAVFSALMPALNEEGA